MWGSHSLGGVSTHAGALFGKIRRALARDTDDSEVDEPVIETAEQVEKPAIVSRISSEGEFEVRCIDVPGGSAGIYVSKPSDAAYFDEVEEYSPVIVAKPAPVHDSRAAPAVKKDRAAAAEPADLFINALRRPVRKKFDASQPVIRAKPAVDNVEVPVSEPVFDVKPSDVGVVGSYVEPSASVSEPVIEPVVDIAAVSEPVVEEAPVAEAVPAPITVEPVAAEDIIIETLEVSEAKVEHELSVAETPVSEPVVDAPVIEPVVDIAAVSEPVVAEAPVAEAVPALITVEPVAVEEAKAEVPAQPMVLALPEPKIVVPVLQKSIAINDLEPVSESSAAVISLSEEQFAETSVEAETEAHIDGTTFEAKAEPVSVPVVIVREERDVLFAFRDDLESDEKEFFATSVDNNAPYAEDLLDETERLFKIRVRHKVTPFTGHFRSLPYI